MNNTNNINPNKITISLAISIFSFILSLFNFGYNIYKDNAESISLWCMDAICRTDYPITDYWEVSGTYAISNNSQQKVSIIDAYVTYKDKRIDSNLDDSTIFPINIDSKSSYRISVEPIKFYHYVDACYFKLYVITSTQKEYSVESQYYLD